MIPVTFPFSKQVFLVLFRNSVIKIKHFFQIIGPRYQCGNRSSSIAHQNYFSKVLFSSTTRKPKYQPIWQNISWYNSAFIRFAVAVSVLLQPCPMAPPRGTAANRSTSPQHTSCKETAQGQHKPALSTQVLDLHPHLARITLSFQNMLFAAALLTLKILSIEKSVFLFLSKKWVSFIQQPPSVGLSLGKKKKTKQNR